MHEARDSVTCLAFSRWQIITGSVDRCVRVYDIRRGECVCTPPRVLHLVIDTRLQ